MPLKKIADFPKMEYCRDPQHNPPGNIVLEPGIYEHECPRCGLKTPVIVPPRSTL